MSKKKSPRRVRLGNARVIWRSGVEMELVEMSKRETLCFKLPPNAQGVGNVWTEDETLRVHDDEMDERTATFLLAGGGRGYFQRRFYGGKQVGAQLTLRDVKAASCYFVEVLYEKREG